MIFGIKTRRDLIKENEELKKNVYTLEGRIKEMHSTPVTDIVTISHNIQKLTASIEYNTCRDVPIEYLKKDVVRKMVDLLYDHVEFDVHDHPHIPLTNILTATLYVSLRK